MALRFSHLIFITLWLSLLLFLFHELYNFKSKINTNTKQSITTTSNTIHFSLSKYPLINRKVLASKFDFTPFQKHHEKSSPSQELQPKDHHQPGPAADHGSAEIDPRYGVEKRLVPTGPNPLHH
ncbi:hypothetical protein AB3S75_035515 [Citrus x aurantiifolia]